MTRVSFALAPSSLFAGAFAIVLNACHDTSAPLTAVKPVSSPPSANVLSIGDLRRAVPHTPCTAPQYRQFDFWLGEWYVTTGGAFDGTNNVTSELDGCLVAEHWTDAGQVKGWSMNTYDRATGLWYQHWVDESGLNLVLSGGLEGSDMVISGPRRTAAGATLIERIRYTPLPGGQMRQFWDRSVDGGTTFNPIFDGHYVPQPGVVPPPAPGTASCAGPGYHGADFLVGEWRVDAANGLELGHSSITRELSNCLLLEQFATPKGNRAKAFLSFGRATATWTRTYMDSEGQRIFSRGTVAGGSLVLTGANEGTLTRITWTKMESGRLEQVWDVSNDGGTTWSFDQKLVYVPA